MSYSFEFSTFLVYASRRSDDNSRKSVYVGAQLKNAAPKVLDHLVIKMNEHREFYSPIFNESTTLVPAPKSSVYNPSALWPSLEICSSLAANRFGVSVNPIIKRVVRVKKSSTSGIGERPSCRDHYSSIEVENRIIEESQIVVVDDVFTKGNTTVACALKLKKLYPDKTIKIFSVMRTRGFINELDSIIDPRIQTLTINDRGIISLPD